MFPELLHLLRFLLLLGCGLLVPGWLLGRVLRTPGGPAGALLGSAALLTNLYLLLDALGFGDVEIDAGLSSQYVSAMLMAAACARAPVEVALKGADIGAKGYVDLTLAAMRVFGAAVEALEDRHAWRISPTGYRASDLLIEPDASAATYFWSAEALTGGRIDLGVAPGAFTQPDAKAYDLIRQFPHLPAVIEGSQIQDAIPTLAVLAAFNATPARDRRRGLRTLP